MSVKPSASSAYEAPSAMPSRVFWTSSASRAKVGAPDDFVLGERAGIAAEAHASLLHEEEMLRHLQRHVRVLLDEKDGGAVAVQLRDGAEDLLDHQRREPQRR